MNLIDKLPPFYDNPVTKPIQDSLSLEADILHEEVQKLLNECLSADNATSYLDYWEKMIGLKSNNLSVQTRRENVKAKMRSRGATTLSVMKNICESYSNGLVEIIENVEDFSFVIKFVGTLGIPQAFEELDKTINEIKPCFLAHSYEFTYMTWNEFDNYNKTWDMWDTLNLTWNQFEIHREV